MPVSHTSSQRPRRTFPESSKARGLTASFRWTAACRWPAARTRRAGHQAKDESHCGVTHLSKIVQRVDTLTGRPSASSNKDAGASPAFSRRRLLSRARCRNRRRQPAQRDGQGETSARPCWSTLQAASGAASSLIELRPDHRFPGKSRCAAITLAASWVAGWVDSKVTEKSQWIQALRAAHGGDGVRLAAFLDVRHRSRHVEFHTISQLLVFARSSMFA
jgi:hypothetical protein